MENETVIDDLRLASENRLNTRRPIIITDVTVRDDCSEYSDKKKFNS